jgi:hypothetical protein
MVRVFSKRIKKTARSQLQTTTFRNFSGGLNTVADDLATELRFAKTLTNFRRNASGSQQLRFGQNLFTDIADTNNSPIVDQTYFNNRIVNVCADGKIVTVTDAGTKAIIWSAAIAALLPGAPGGWSTGLTLITFVPWRDKLIIHNGVDKPLIISSAFAVTYLQDAGTGSNTNVPIGKYGCIAANYHCVAGIAGSPTVIVISAQSTSGTFPGDPAPNDAISIDVGAYAPEGAAEIRGIAGYRSYLMVFLQQITLQVQLGVYDDATPPNHTPKFPDNIPTFGLVGSRCVVKVDVDLIFAGLSGLANAEQNTFVTGQLNSSSQSAIIDNTYRSELGNLTDTQKKLNTFVVHDRLNNDLIILYPGGKALVYTTNKKLNYKAWSTYSNMNWTCGCTSLLGRMFLTQGTKIFQSGNEVFGETYSADRVGDYNHDWGHSVGVIAGQLYRDTDTGLVYTSIVSHTTSATGTFEQERTAIPAYWEQYFGAEIPFEFELPWTGGRNSMQVKKIKYIQVVSKGTAEFTLEAYVDNLFKDENNNIVYDPALSTTFVGNDAPGYNYDLDVDPYGTGRRSGEPRLWKFPVKFKSVKLRFIGSTRKPLTLVSMTFLFSRGGYMRG